jgi:hypothetical protein
MTIFITTGAIQTYTVTTSGIYDLTALGGQGGSAADGIQVIGHGGYGAKVEGKVHLSAGTVLTIIVAGSGLIGSIGPLAAGGGGGGSFIYASNGTLLEAAGGGGGAGWEGATGGNGQSTNSGQDGSTANTNGGTPGAGGINGNGGGGGQTTFEDVNSRNGGGGAGWLTSGGNALGFNNQQTPLTGGITKPLFTGGVGFQADVFPNNGCGGNGGFGGGGAGGVDGGGGGGGYSGGGGGAGQLPDLDPPTIFPNTGNNYGGGGGSYIIASALNPILLAGVQAGNGEVDITLIASDIPSSVSINNLNFSNTALSGSAIFTSVAGDYCTVNLSHGSGYFGGINSLISVDNLVALSSPNLQAQGLLSNGEQILPQCNLNAGILASFINPGATALHYEFVSGLANGSSISLTNAAAITPYLTDVVVVNSLSNTSATVDISNFGGVVIAGKGVNVIGLTTNNHLIASGNAMYTFGAGNQTMDLAGSNAVINGGDGIDTVIMQDQAYSPIAINTTMSGSTTITQVWSGQGVSTLTNVDYLQFGNQTIAIDVGIGQNAGEAYRLYQAAFNRTPDQTGLDNWITQLDQGASIISVANAFINSAEFAKAYGANLSNGALVNALYSNVLHRAADTSGSAYWINALNNGTSRAQVLELFSESVENVGNTASLIGQGIVHQVA